VDSGPTHGRHVVLVLVTLLLVFAGSATAIGAAASNPPQLIRADRPAPAAQGWQATYTDSSGLPARWDPCRPIPYVVSPRRLGASARRDLDEALRRISAASGLRFEHLGDVDEEPARRRSAYQPERYGERWAPLLVAWVGPGETDMAIGRKVPGTSMVVAVANHAGGSLVSGQVVLHRDRPMAEGFGPGLSRGKVLLHEIAHVLGLGHVDDPQQVMHPKVTGGPATLGTGDRTGLAALGARRGCHPAPAPRPLDPPTRDDERD
jgi:hypothetical protein